VPDASNELDEVFYLRIDSPVGALLCVTQAVCTLSNDDFVCVSIGNTQVVEGNAGWTSAVFAVTLDALSFQEVRVGFRTQDGSARAANNDYAASNGLVILAPGTLTQTISIPVRGNTVDEPDRTFLVILTNAVNARTAFPRGFAPSLMMTSPASPWPTLKSWKATAAPSQKRCLVCG